MFFCDKDVYSKEQKLKHFYLIDTDNIKNTIKKSNEYINFVSNPLDETMIELFFNKVFEVIFNGSSQYNLFLEPSAGTFTSFFCENDIDLTLAMVSLLKLSLRNHCIIYGLFNSFDEKNRIEISGSNDKFNSIGYFESLGKQKDKNYRVDIAENIFQNYYQLYNRFKKEHFSSSLLNIHSITKYSDTNTEHFKIPEHLKNFGRFLMTNPKIRTVDRNLIDKKANIIKNYSKLSSSFNSPETNFSNATDKLLFCAPMEYYYGFSTVNFIIKLLKEINETNPEDKLTLKDLEGQILINIISDMPHCHLIYSRAFFLKYACMAVINSNVPYSNYLDSKPGTISQEIDSSENVSKYYKITTGLNRISQFFKTINQLTIPILEDLWDICINSLQNDLIGIDLPHIYKKYIDKNYNIITADFTTLSNEDILSCNNAFNMNTHKIDQTIGSWFAPNVLNAVLSKSHALEYDFDFPPHIKRDIIQILLSSMDIKHFDNTENNIFINNILSNDLFKTNHVRSIINSFTK